MSGIEVIGLVLALYPVVVNAWQIHKAATSGLDVNPIVRRLTTEQILFDEFVQHLVGSVIPDERRTQLSITNPNEEGIWKDAKVQADLGKRFKAEKLKNILTIVGSIHTLLTSIQKEVTSRSFTRQQTSAFRYTHILKNATLQKHLIDLREQNSDLQRLFPVTERPSRELQRNIEIQLRHHDPTGYALNVYKAIRKGYNCNCESPHHASLIIPRLEYLGQERANCSDAESDGLQLMFSLEGSTTASLTSPTSPTTDTDISIQDTSEHIAVVSEELSSFWTLMAAQTHSPSGLPQPRARRMSEFTIHECGNDQGGATVGDLCAFFRTLGEGINEGSTVDPEEPGVICSDGRRYELHNQSSPDNSPDFNCLQDFLDSQAAKKRERMKLALELSSAIRQHYCTGWIRDTWTWRDFSISGIERQDASEPQLLVNAKFYSAQKVSTQGSTTTNIFWTTIGEPILTRLGFALIELALGKKLSELRDSDWSSASMDPDTVDYLTARNILERRLLRDEQGLQYEAVVEACLDHQYYSKTTSKRLNSKNPSFHQDFEECVINPLHRIWSQNWGVN